MVSEKLRSEVMQWKSTQRVVLYVLVVMLDALNLYFTWQDNHTVEDEVAYIDYYSVFPEEAVLAETSEPTDVRISDQTDNYGEMPEWMQVAQLTR